MFLLFSALYAKCPYYLMLYMQSVLIIYCFVCKVFLLYSALYAKVSLLFSALYAKCPYCLGLYVQSGRKASGKTVTTAP